MLTLYHNAVSVCSQKVRLQLEEKRIPYEERHLSLMNGEHLRPEFLALNPRGLVPTIVHDGVVVIESTVILEYLEDAFPTPSLRPATPAARARMRLWAKVPDERIHTACATVSFAATFARQLQSSMSPADLERRLADMPDQERANRQRALMRDGFRAPFAKAALQYFDRIIGDMERDLEKGAWLAGEEISLAEMAMAPYVERLHRLTLAKFWEDTRPRVTDWFARLRARPSFASAFDEWKPRDYDDLLRDRGEELWPQVGPLLERSAA